MGTLKLTIGWGQCTIFLDGVGGACNHNIEISYNHYPPEVNYSGGKHQKITCIFFAHWNCSDKYKVFSHKRIVVSWASYKWLLRSNTIPKYWLIRIKNIYEGTVRIKNSFKFRNYGICYNFQVKVLFKKCIDFHDKTKRIGFNDGGRRRQGFAKKEGMLHSQMLQTFRAAFL